MKTTTISKHTVEYYDSIDDLPIVRFHKYNKMLLVDAGLGSDLTDIDSHVERAIAFIKTKKPDQAIGELLNLRKNVFFVQMNLSPKHLAFAALVYSIDGKVCNDLSDDGLKKVVETLSGTTKREMADIIEESKKKIDSELVAYFPAMFDNAEIKEYYTLMKKRIVATLDGIINGDYTEADRLTNEFITFANPPDFDTAENVEIKCDKNFERMCLMISQHLNTDAKKLSTLAFYNAFDYLRETLRRNNKNK
jgi:hypothetical protein